MEGALADAGLAVPDVSVVSFDDDVLASWVRPQLTTVALPHYELGRAAIQVPLDRGQTVTDQQPRIHLIPMPLRDRESVRRLARSQGQRGAKVLASAATSNAAPLVPEVVQAQR